MKTTLNPFENAKRTGGEVSPAVIEEMQAEISILGSQNETQARDITDIKGSLNSINDKLPRISVYTQISKENVTVSASSYTTISFDITPVQGYISKVLVYMSNSNSHDIVPVTCAKLLQGTLSTNLEVRNVSNSNVTTTIYAMVIWEIA